MGRFIKYLIIFCFFLFLAIFSIIKPYDQSSYISMPFHQQMLARIDSVDDKKTTVKGLLTAGWAKSPILPPVAVPIASYGIRENYESVHDTIFARAFSFSNGSRQATLVTIDLLIFPPALYQYIADSLGSSYMHTLFLSATHTHNGPGGWLKGPAARFIAGSYSHEYLQHLGNTIIQVISEAQANRQPSNLSYHEAPHTENIANRLVRNDGTDSILRYTVINQQNRKAILVSYGAHANCISHKINEISADYPGEVCKELETRGYDMAAFIAGAVGGMTNNCNGLTDYECTSHIGKSIAHKILSIPLEHQLAADSLQIQSGNIDLLLKDPAPRIAKNWTLRPWIFRQLLGTQSLFISYLKLGNISFIGTPCDFSGVIAREIYEQNETLPFIITSFNGSYAGYITPLRYDHLEKNETREMNWLGYDNGTYFKTLIDHLLSSLYAHDKTETRP